MRKNLNNDFHIIITIFDLPKISESSACKTNIIKDSSTHSYITLSKLHVLNDTWNASKPHLILYPPISLAAITLSCKENSGEKLLAYSSKQYNDIYITMYNSQVLHLLWRFLLSDVDEYTVVRGERAGSGMQWSAICISGKKMRVYIHTFFSWNWAWYNWLLEIIYMFNI